MVKIIALAETAAVDLEELMRYRLTEICLPLFNIIYADKTSHTISEARVKKWRAMKNNISAILRLQSDEDSFEQHLLRANYQARIWYNFANPDGPPKSTGSWIHTRRSLCITNTTHKRSMPEFVERFGP